MWRGDSRYGWALVEAVEIAANAAKGCYALQSTSNRAFADSRT